jgi:superfamily II DNA or RNA helicase
MPKKPSNKQRKKSSPPVKKKGTGQSIAASDLARLEFHRHAVALLPDSEDKDPGLAVMVAGKGAKMNFLNCNCAKSRSRSCSHTKKLAAVYGAVQATLGDKTLQQDFRESVWYQIAVTIAAGSADTPQSVRTRTVSQKGHQVLKVVGSHGEEMLTYLSAGSDRERFFGRCIGRPKKGKIPSRTEILQELTLWTLSDTERKMSKRGFKTRQQALQEKFWYKVAYHFYRELGTRNFSLASDIDTQKGTFFLTVRDLEDVPISKICIPRLRLKALLDSLNRFETLYTGLKIFPIPLISLLRISPGDNKELEITPLLQLTLQNGKTHIREEAAIQKFRHGDLVYLADLDILGKHKRSRRIPTELAGPAKKIIKKEDIPDFLASFGEDLSNGPFLPDASIKTLNIFKRPDHIQFTPQALERDWCWLSVMYGFGNSSLSLSEILQAKTEGRRFIETTDGWMDAQSPEFEGLEVFLEPSATVRYASNTNRIGMSRLDLLRLQATAAQAVKVDGKRSLADRLRRLLHFKPAAPLPAIKGLTSKLRAYQQRGTEWIHFLYENGFGGLLCDDMGLGKTHEVMAFMLYLRKHRKLKKPFLVVCPTTVLSHWSDKIAKYASDLKTAVYHGGLRDMKNALEGNDVLLTSYGILRRDIHILKKRAFGLAVFDEIQHIKNRHTQAYTAAVLIRSRMKLGLTGTPIENSLDELKSLMDLVIPGYLGSDEKFKNRYVNPIEINIKSPRRRELSRIISPFTLRRLKATVLSELPPKIEDIRTCHLSEDQVKLYRDAVASRGHQLVQLLNRRGERVPYIHIFALLTLLKQICNHPATVEADCQNYDQFQSGKWELFKELLSESLDSGQKVVVYSQYLDMIRIMENYLAQNDVDFATLTGASRQRGKIISRFNNDPACRVFVGSLKAGGTGIDLVAASVVIHYDRWWNAAKEDQATDRVHRIGQKRGVQVFKLITQGTLEEKISAIIEKKKNLMNGVVQEDDPGMLKGFSRQQLIELIAAPE